MARQRYRAKYGDTWNTIAEQYGVPINTLVGRNKLSAPIAGASINIPYTQPTYTPNLLAPPSIQYPTYGLQDTGPPGGGQYGTGTTPPPTPPSSPLPPPVVDPLGYISTPSDPGLFSGDPTTTGPTTSAPSQNISDRYWSYGAPMPQVATTQAATAPTEQQTAAEIYGGAYAADREAQWQHYYGKSSPASPDFKPEWTPYMDYTGEYPHQTGAVRPRYMTQDEAQATATPSVQVKGQFSNKKQYIAWLISTYGTKQLAARYGIKRKDITAKQLEEKLSVRIKGWPGKGTGGATPDRPDGGEGGTTPAFRGPPLPPRRPGGSGGGQSPPPSRDYYRGPVLDQPYGGRSGLQERYASPRYFGAINWRV